MKRTQRWTRGRLLFLAVSAGYVGFWAQLFPRSFYNSFPGFGRHWIDIDGPFNEHLIRDVGGLNLALLAVTAAALLRTSSLLLRVTGAAWLVMELPHAAYHGLHDTPAGSTTDRVLAEASLGTLVASAIALVFLAGKREAIDHTT